MAKTLTTVTGLAGVPFVISEDAATARAAELQARVKRCRAGRSDVLAYGIVQTVLGAIRDGEIFVVWQGSDCVHAKEGTDGKAVLILDEDAKMPTHKDKYRAFATTTKVCILAT